MTNASLIWSKPWRLLHSELKLPFLCRPRWRKPSAVIHQEHIWCSPPLLRSCWASGSGSPDGPEDLLRPSAPGFPPAARCDAVPPSTSTTSQQTPSNTRPSAPKQISDTETHLKLPELILIQRKNIDHHIAAGVHTKLSSVNQTLCNWKWTRTVQKHSLSIWSMKADADTPPVLMKVTRPEPVSLWYSSFSTSPPPRLALENDSSSRSLIRSSGKVGGALQNLTLFFDTWIWTWTSEVTILYYKQLTSTDNMLSWTQ